MWQFGWERPVLRNALRGLNRYVGTTETAKHRVFQFIDASVLADHTVVCIALDDARFLGVLSSSVHVTWALNAGGRLGVGNDPRYNKTRCFDPFPFPAASDEQQARIRDLGEQLDAHRKRQQALHADLTLTGMYNVLEKLRGGDALTPKERKIHEQGLVSVLRQLHDELDTAVLDAYGWSDLLPLLQVARAPSVRAERSAEGAESKGSRELASTSPATAGVASPEPVEGLSANGVADRDGAKRTFDEAILERLVALNAERAAEEARGRVRWLWPEFQHPSAEVAPRQGEIESGDEGAQAPAPATAGKPRPWPKDAIEQVRAVAGVLSASAAPLSADQVAAHFTARGAWKKRLPPMLDMLAALARAREHKGRYSAT